MRTFIVTRDGVARVMRTYALGQNGRVITDDPRDADIEEIVPAPHANDKIVKWHPDKIAAVSSVREITEADIPADTEFKDAWVDDGAAINIPLAAARRVAQRRIAPLVRRELALLDHIRTEAQIEDDATLVGQIDARKTAIQSTIIPAIRDGIISATSIADLKAVRQAYLDSRPQAVKKVL